MGLPNFRNKGAFTSLERTYPAMMSRATHLFPKQLGSVPPTLLIPVKVELHVQEICG